ncbi:MAG: response regulator [Thiotrichaceae bacterium]|nr:response regulator [Thiotrichaceae bacterium]
MNKKRTVLIVEDDEAIRKSLKECFEREGFLVTEAINGFEAETYLRQETPDYLLLEIVSPDKDRIEMILDLKHAGTNVFVMSGSSGCLRFAEKLGADAVLLKPFDLTYLNELISLLILLKNIG